MRIGHGYDVHRLTEGRKLILGGIELPYEKGLLGHSDADVLVHALMDAMLGAAALGDIGRLFPDNDDAYLGADSILLLEKVTALLRERGYVLSNADCTVIAQKPKLAPYINSMRQRIAEAVGVSLSRISVKATTEERLGFTGEGLGIAARSLNYMQTIGIADIVDILIVAFLIYRLILLTRKTNSYNLAKGLLLFLIALWMAEILELNMISFILRKATELGVVVLVILFQPELRHILEKIGSRFSSRSNMEDPEVTSAITQTVT